MSQQLANGYRTLAMLGKLWPVGSHPLLIVEESTRVRESYGECSQAFGGR